MGLIEDIQGPVSQYMSQLSTPSQVGVIAAGVLFFSVFLNVLQQILFRNPNEPPVVFHWFPLVGSTITYGMDPPRFFRENRAKVRFLRYPCAYRESVGVLIDTIVW